MNFRLEEGLLTQRPRSPDEGRGRDAPRVRGTRLRVDAEREGRLVIGDWIMGIGDWVEGGGWPYYAPKPLCGGAPKGARNGRVIQGGEEGWIDFIRELR